jgi:hypothetical protein
MEPLIEQSTTISKSASHKIIFHSAHNYFKNVFYTNYNGSDLSFWNVMFPSTWWKTLVALAPTAAAAVSTAIECANESNVDDRARPPFLLPKDSEDLFMPFNNPTISLAIMWVHGLPASASDYLKYWH